MLDQFFLLPTWVLSLAGALLGALIGLALAIPFRKSRPGMARYLPLAVAIVGYAAADRFLVPAIADLGLADCAVARDYAQQLTAQYAGTQPDPATTFTAATADCEAKALTTAYTSTAAASDVTDEGIAAVKLRFTADTCGQPALRRLIDRGWVVEAVYEFARGEPLVMRVEC